MKLLRLLTKELRLRKELFRAFSNRSHDFDYWSVTQGLSETNMDTQLEIFYHISVL